MSGDVVVVGATGLLGGEVCRRLLASGSAVRAVVRPGTSPDRRERLVAAGCACVDGDLEQPDSLAACLEGASAVISTATAFPRDARPDAITRVDRDGQLALVDAAAAAGVGRFVYISFPPIPTATDFPFQRAKRSVEERLGAIGIDHVILQPGKFMDVWFSPPLGFDVRARTVRLYGDGNARQSWVAVSDVADAAVRALQAGDVSGRPLAFGGPQDLSQHDVIATYEQLLGISIKTETVSAEALEAMRVNAAGPTEESLAAILLGATRPDAIESDDAQARLGLSLTSVEDFVASRVAQLRGL